MKKVTLIHTSFALVEDLNKLFEEILPGVEVMHIVDTSLLEEVLKKGKVTKNVIKKMLLYFKSAEYSNADCVLNVCSSVREIVYIAKEIFETPILNIDEKMAEEAVLRGKNIGLIATLNTSLDPTFKLLEKKAKEKGKKINIKTILCSKAFEELARGNIEKHNEIVLKEIKKLVNSVDVVVLA